MENTLLLEEMTWLDVRNALDADVDTVLVLVGSMEQHGKHLPFATDSLLSQELGLRIAKHLGRTLVAPVIRVGRSEHHMDFPGTITHRSEILIEVIKDYATSLARHGFKNIVLVPIHGGNFAAAREAYEQLKQEVEGVNWVVYDDLPGFVNTMFRSAAKFGVSQEAAGGHAGEWETSVAMAMRPDLVHEERIETGWLGDVLAISPLLATRTTKSFTSNGIFGDPHGATAEKGEAYLTDLAEAVASSIRGKLG